MIKELTCIVCPIGCTLSVNIEGDAVTEVKGNTCNRGKVYAENECVNPQRTITSTMKCVNGEVITVKTDCAIPKSKMFECMNVINNTVVKTPVSVGDILVKDVFGSNIVATQNK